MAADRDNNRRIIADNIDRDPVGRKLTPEARERAIDFGTEAWRGPMGNGKAAQLGIRHATSAVLREE